jgi:hypothetical protein
VTGENDTASPPPRTQPSLAQLLIHSNDGRTLNDVAYALIGAHAYTRALPFARKAVQKAQPGTLTHAYATFNLGLALLELGRCRESLPLLRHALALEPPVLRPLVRPRITQAERCSQRGASVPAQSVSSAASTGPSRAR